jgi:hypothetical protein
MSGTTQTQIDLLEMSPIQVVGVLHDVCIPPIADQAHHSVVLVCTRLVPLYPIPKPGVGHCDSSSAGLHWLTGNGAPFRVLE